MSVTLKEIREQDEAIETVYEHLTEKKDSIKNTIEKSNSVLFTGCGTSYYLGLTGASLFNKIGLDATASPGSEILISNDFLPEKNPNLLIPISRSGETSETVKAVKKLQKEKSLTTLGLTCHENSPLSNLSNPTIVSTEGKEDGIVMTKSFSSMIFALDFITKTIHKNKKIELRNFKPIKNMLKKSEELAQEIGKRKDLEKFFFLGTGELYGVACESMLKLEEMTLSWTKAYHPLEFRHGPRSIIDEDTLITLFWPNRGEKYHKNLLEELNDSDAETLLVGDGESIKSLEAKYKIPLSKLGNEQFLAMYLPIVQFLGYYRAKNLGLDPDEPKNLNQVVKIDD